MTTIAELLAETSAVLLDFDGPICGIFADGRNRRIADHLRAELPPRHDLPPEVADTPDPLQVLRYAATLHEHDLTHIEQVLIADERDAARQVEPTPHAHDAIRAAVDSGRPVVVVSNNSHQAIHDYLGRHDLSDQVLAVIGRPFARPDLMKPHPYSIERALVHVELPAARCVLIGDSVTDIEAAHTAGTRSIAYAKAPDRVPRLLDANPDAITESMEALAEDLAHTTA